MAAVLEKMEDFANNIAAAYTTTHLVPRGVPRFVDQALKGTLKFSRRIGNTLPTIQPQNQITLTQDAAVLQNILNVNSILPGYAPKSLVRINNQEVVEVADVDTSLLIITLTEDLFVAHSSGNYVDLFGIPAYVYGPVAPGGVLPAHVTTTFYVRSSYRIITGDQLYIQQTPSLILSGTSFTVTDAVPLYPLANDFITMVTLDQPIPRDLALNDTVYLRTFPGYVSPIVTIPSHRRRPMYMGPFVVDYVSGRFDDGDDIVENLDLQAYDSIGRQFLGVDPVISNQTYFSRSAKNTPIISVPIHASSFLFWEVIRGKINYQPDHFMLIADDSGRAVISTELTPAWTGPQTWICQAQGVTADFGSVYSRFYPNSEVLAGSISMASPSTLEFTLTGQSATRLEIVFTGPPNGIIKFGSWFPVLKSSTLPVVYTDNTITKLQYTISARVIGNTIWQAGSLMIKPYFNVLADIEGIHDFDSFDNGAVMF